VDDGGEGLFLQETPLASDQADTLKSEDLDSLSDVLIFSCAIWCFFVCFFSTVWFVPTAAYPGAGIGVEIVEFLRALVFLRQAI